MSQEMSFDCTAWWNELNFDGKDQYTISAEGKISHVDGAGTKEKVVAEVTAENAEDTYTQAREKYTLLLQRAAELEKEWAEEADKLKLAEKLSAVVHQLHGQGILGDLQAIAARIKPMEDALGEIYEANYAEKVKLAELAESMTDSEDWKNTANAYKELTDNWKQTGPADKHKSDRLWLRIEDAKTKFFDRKRQHHDEQEKDLLVNLDLKLDLVEQAESLINSSEWKKTSETFHRLTNEWKTIGHTLNKKNEELWQRFIDAKKAFFDRKREHSDRIQVEQEKNLADKTVLVEKAEALRDSREWNKTAQQFAALMDEWKKTGRVNGEKGDELWNRFTTAQEQFFSAKKAHAGEVREVHERNYEQKMELLQRAEQIKNSNHWADTTAEMNELLDKWKKIGPVAREVSEKIWEQFIAARKHFFNRKDSNREQRKQHHETMKTFRAEQAREMVGRLLREIAEEEEKLVDFKAALENVTPGKKADELKEHLQKLLVEGEQKIKRLREKYAAVQEEYGKKPAETANAGAEQAQESAPDSENA